MKDPQDYPRPALTADVVAFARNSAGQYQIMHVLLVKRENEPFKDCWALPGGFVNEHEPPIEAAKRECREETNAECEELEQIGAFSDPDRDPRGWVVSVAFWTMFHSTAEVELRPADDAKEAKWFPLTDLPDLAFDHDKIITAAKRLARL